MAELRYHLRYARTHYRVAYLYDAEQELVTVLLIAKRENFYQTLTRRLS
jgi:mRNA-degrading endonuclease RelE of RelBE toxin-antitoxin system